MLITRRKFLGGSLIVGSAIVVAPAFAFTPKRPIVVAPSVEREHAIFDAIGSLAGGFGCRRDDAIRIGHYYSMIDMEHAFTSVPYIKNNKLFFNKHNVVEHHELIKQLTSAYDDASARSRSSLVGDAMISSSHNMARYAEAIQLGKRLRRDPNPEFIQSLAEKMNGNSINYNVILCKQSSVRSLQKCCENKLFKPISSRLMRLALS